MFNYSAMDRKAREHREDQDRLNASHVARVNGTYRAERLRLKDKHDRETELLRQKQTTERARELRANPGMARDTPSPEIVRNARNREWKALEDKQRGERNDAAQRYEHELEKARALDASKQVVKPGWTGRPGVTEPKQFSGGVHVRRG
jgi:hypothetical protein